MSKNFLFFFNFIFSPTSFPFTKDFAGEMYTMLTILVALVYGVVGGDGVYYALAEGQFVASVRWISVNARTYDKIISSLRAGLEFFCCVVCGVSGLQDEISLPVCTS